MVKLDSTVFIMFVITVLILIPEIAILYSDFLWFKSIGYESVFIKIISAEIGIFLIAVLISFFIVSINLYIADRTKTYKQKKWIGVGILSIVLGFLYANSWDIALKYLNQVQFGINDPIFNKDIAFYIFTLPFYRLVQNFLFTILILSIISVILVYIKNRDITLIKTETEYEFDVYAPRYQLQTNFFDINEKVKIHLYILIGFLFLLLGWKHSLDRYTILYSETGIIFGAGYTDINAYLPVISVLVFLSIGIAIMFFIASVLKLKKKVSIWGLLMAVVIVYLLTLLLGTTVYPAIIQQYKVLPNEIALEREYIKNNIEYTRHAYNLDNIKDFAITPSENVSIDYVLKNEDITNNIRLWDWRPLKQTYKQMQEIRSYYDFNDVDIDRYALNTTNNTLYISDNRYSKYIQVMLSAREINYEQLGSEARTWVNKHLLYTHGYGLCMSPVNTFTESGLPEFFIKDIPPISTIDEFRIERPEIYYGEKTDDFVIVKTTIKEFDYPKGDENKFTIYNGTGGILLDSFIKKLVMAVRFGDVNIILSEYITPESRILLNRNIHERVWIIAPFLIYDSDPYVVTVNGKIYWIQDAYTYTDRYPYSTPYKDMDLNYIRNSVKVVIDAYNGNTDFYVIDSKDPLIRTYMNIFPDLFHRFDEMPSSLKKHIRYPEDLFRIQVDVYGIYHMTDPTVFYNKEDKWVVPNEVYGQSNKVRMIPYYIITKLPEKKDLEFILMIPLTPKNKDNMIAWMAAKCDEDYGELIIYKFPKDKLIFGPMQIEARIDQDDKISQQLTLWSQRGSDVIRGNLLVIPLGNTLLYVEPLYIKAEKATMPELKRVIVFYKSRVIMERDLKHAFSKLFSIDIEEVAEEMPRGIKNENKTIIELIDIALEHYNNAESNIKDGNWSGFGEELRNLKMVLLDMKNITTK